MRAFLNLVLNIVWLVVGGILLPIAYAFAGIICFILIVTIPFGVAAFRMANYALWPFGRTLVRKPDAGVGSAIGNIIWTILFGWWLALLHIITGVAQFVTVVGIPAALANFKLVPVSITPLGHEIVDSTPRPAA